MSTDAIRLEGLAATWSPYEPQLVSGALMDAGNLAGDLRPSTAIRLLTIERDEAKAFLLRLHSLALQDHVDVEALCNLALDKPLVVVVPPGRALSERLRRAADAVVETDIDTEAGQAEFQEVIADLLGDAA